MRHYWNPRRPSQQHWPRTLAIWRRGGRLAGSIVEGRLSGTGVFRRFVSLLRLHAAFGVMGMPDMQPSRSFPILPDDVELWLLWLLALGAPGPKAIHHAPTSAPTNGPSWGPSLPGPKSYDHARPIVFGTPTFFLSCVSLPRLVFHSTHYCSVSLFAKKHPLPLVRAPIQTILPRLCPHPQPSQVFLHLPRWRKSRSSSATCCVSTTAPQLRAQALTVVFYPHSRSWSEHVRVSTPLGPAAAGM